jgi:hypothetical protein
MHQFVYSKTKLKNFGFEELNKEYKEIFLHNISNFFTNNDLDNFINSSKININKFNKLISVTINLYIMNYLPKYIGVFINSNISGDLYFGINDIGDTIGIPFFGNLNTAAISDAIYQTKLYLRSYTSEEIVDNILSNIKVEICEISKYDTTKNQFLENLYNFQEIDKKINNDWVNYCFKYNNWHKQILKYSIKLSKFLDLEEMRHEIALWIRSYKNKAVYSNNDLERIARIYDNNIFIDKKICVDFIESIRYDYTHPVKWLIEFKDYKISEIKKQKPIAPIIKPLKDNIIKFCSNIKNISYLLNRLNCKFYVLKFHIPLFHNSINIEHYSEKQSKWLYRSRILNNSGPSCL